MSYFKPAAPVSIEIEIKQSRFICYIQPVSGRAEADAFVQSIKQLHPKANHNCWSYIADAPDNSHQWNFSDDGEPKGTAGQPMLNILRYSGLGQVCAVVTRYFGGIKLGTGGLVRAYGRSVQEALEETCTEEVIAKSEIQLLLPYNLTGDIEYLTKQYQIEIIERNFGDQLQIIGAIKLDQIEPFVQALIPFQHQVEITID